MAPLVRRLPAGRLSAGDLPSASSPRIRESLRSFDALARDGVRRAIPRAILMYFFLRYERARPGELVHIDVKKLGRIVGGAGKRVWRGSSHYTGSFTDQAGKRRRRAGWDYVHVAVDDATRLAYAEVLTDEQATTAVAFLRRALSFFARYGITVERVITDNGSAYRSTIHALACRALGVRHLRTRPRRPQTNGRIERFIRTLQAGWAYGAIYASSAQRTAALDGWLWHYNHRRRHAGIGRATPSTRLNNLLGTYN